MSSVGSLVSGMDWVAPRIDNPLKMPTLPMALQYSILSYLNVQDVTRALSACKNSYSLIKADFNDCIAPSITWARKLQEWMRASLVLQNPSLVFQEFGLQRGSHGEGDAILQRLQTRKKNLKERLDLKEILESQCGNQNHEVPMVTEKEELQITNELNLLSALELIPREFNATILNEIGEFIVAEDSFMPLYNPHPGISPKTWKLFGSVSGSGLEASPAMSALMLQPSPFNPLVAVERDHIYIRFPMGKGADGKLIMGNFDENDNPVAAGGREKPVAVVNGEIYTLRKFVNDFQRVTGMPLDIDWEPILPTIGDLPMLAGECIIPMKCMPGTTRQAHPQQLEIHKEYNAWLTEKKSPISYRVASIWQTMIASGMKYIETGERPYQDEQGRTTTTLRRVLDLGFGGYDYQWPNVDSCPDHAYANLGLAVVIKPAEVLNALGA